MTKFNFERFEQNGGSYAPKISIRANGAMGFSQGALRRYGMETGDWLVVLFFDKSQRIIGIQPTQEESATGAIKLIKRMVKARDGKTSLNAYISARSFLNYYAISFTNGIQQFEPTWDEESKMILVDLNKRKGGSHGVEQEK